MPPALHRAPSYVVGWVKIPQLYRTYPALAAVAAAQAFPKAEQLEGRMDKDSVPADPLEGAYTICSM